MRVSFKRYGHCVGDLPPLKGQKLNETQYLVQSIGIFLDQANYDNEQLANVTSLMDNICQNAESNYVISANIDVNKYNTSHPQGKLNRCKAVEEALNSMYSVFKRAALNRSEPLDFSSILFYPNISDKSVYYNLTDLVNTSWIKSDTMLDHVCSITNSVKDYVRARITNSTAQDRSQQQPVGIFSSLFDFIDSYLDSVFGFNKRLYWESTNRLESVYSGIASQLDSLRVGVGKGLKNTRDRVTSIFVSSNSTSPANATQAFNSSRTTSSQEAYTFRPEVRAV